MNSEDDYQNILDLILKIFQEIPQNLLQKEIRSKIIDCTKLDTQLSVLFLEMSTYNGFNSLLCMQIQKTLYDYSDSKNGLDIPIIFIYNKLEKIGYVDNLPFDMVTTHNRNMLDIIIFEDVNSVIELYEKNFDVLINNCNFGVIFKTNFNRNIDYIANAIKQENLESLYERINQTEDSCIIYQKGIKTSVENQINEHQYEESENDFNINIKDENSIKPLENIETREDVWKALKIDIDNETDSIKKEHLIKIYNAFKND